jgi:hypothetical protein
VISDNAFSILVPVLDQVLDWEPRHIRDLFESYGLTLTDWERDRTDRVLISQMFGESAPLEAVGG